jgi:phosphoglycerate dehydrogenase-like enzyme
MIDLPTQTVPIVGVVGAGSEASKQCAASGMRVVGIDPRTTDRPAGMADLSDEPSPARISGVCAPSATRRTRRGRDAARSGRGTLCPGGDGCLWPQPIA